MTHHHPPNITRINVTSLSFSLILCLLGILLGHGQHHFHISGGIMASETSQNNNRNRLQIPIISDHDDDSKNSNLPAFKVFLPLETQQYLLEETIPSIRGLLLQHLSIPSIHVTPGIPVIGAVDINLSNIQLKDVSNIKDRCRVHLMSPYWGVLLGEPHWVYIDVKGKFDTRQRNWPHVSTNGEFVANIGLKMTLGLDMEPDTAEQCLMRVKAVNSNVEVGPFNVHLDGSVPSWLFDIFMKVLKPKLEDAVERTMNSLLPELVVESLQDNLNQFQFKYAVGEPEWGTLVDFGLKKFQVGDSQVVNFGGSGEFEKDSVIRFPGDPQYVPSAEFDGESLQNRQLQIALDEYSLASMAYVLHKGDILQAEYRIPEVTTDNFTLINQFLSEKFPHCPMQLSVSTSDAPSVRISPGLIHVEAPCEAVFQVVYQENNKQEIFDAFTVGIHAVANITANVTYNAENVYGEVNFLGDQTTYELISSEVGEIHHFDYLKIVIDMMIQRLINEVINPRAKKGIPLPSLPVLHLFNAEMDKRHSGYILVNSELEVKLGEDRWKKRR